ncbi:pentapeptide repeat-containing protein [Coleofasciculus sp. FACHB-T130]|uniref:pentapeptide repeat-containing protein n=1 Tax=Cyanophyceae TaxID=3028117 RepID=UPI001681E394|nr:pentapeptide repeat-containing protein [Coleofasciculus sp. FACHB-T130]MBD1882156.1 pentapeptide repeat-containing protein [Coleofasciculus sp. FACHB-T130]
MTSYKCDIRSINFTKIYSFNKNFQNAQAGLKNNYNIFLSSIGIVASMLNIMPLLSGGVLSFVIYLSLGKDYAISFTGIFIEISIYAASLFLLIVRGYHLASISLIATLIISFTLIGLFTNNELGFAIFLLGLSLIISWLGSITTALSVAFNSLCYGLVSEFIAILGSGLTVAVLVVNIPKLTKVELSVTFIAAIAVILTGAIISRQAIRGSPKFAWIREKAVFWAATGGTSFYGVDLTDACFDGADLPHTDFRNAILTRASFKNVTGLELSRLQGTILEQPNVRKLLINPQEGCGRDYTGANLSGANLREANLKEAILIGAHLNSADLRDANLEGANLTKAQVLDADFSGACLTEACLQEWNINSKTSFKNVTCKLVYLKQGKHGFLVPKPDSGEFQPGEFEKWIEKLQETIDVILRHRLNLAAFAVAIAQTALDYEGLDVARYSIENKGDGVFVAKVGVFPDADKSAIHQSITNYYYNEVSIQGERANILLNPSAEVEIMESKQTDVTGDIVSGDKGDKTTVGDVTVGRDLIGASIVGDISGQVTTTIQQLQGVNTTDSNELAKILTALQEAIKGDSVLSDSLKKEALEAVETIAEEGKKPPEERAIKYCSMAVNALKGVTTAVTDASKLAEVLQTYLPTLTGILGI